MHGRGSGALTVHSRAALALFAAGSAHAQTILHVNADHTTGANDGTSWADAFRGPDALQLAIDAAFPIVSGGGTAQIWVVQGTYLPTDETIPGDPLTVTFGLDSGMQLYGGFAGTETELGERDAAANPTILSGHVPAGRAFHVVTVYEADDTCIIDGFTITGGLAFPGPPPYFQGGGGLLIDGSPTVARCTFTGNATMFTGMFSQGGAAFCTGGTTRFIDCHFAGNTAGSDGGALGGQVNITGSTFSGNGTAFGGGAVAGSGEVHGCTFENNIADGGGALAFGPFNVTSSTFHANEARVGGAGGAGYFLAPSAFADCEFEANRANVDPVVANASLVRCLVRSHEAMHYFVVTGEVRDCIFAGNTGVFGVDGAGPLVNILFVSNLGSVDAAGESSFINCTWFNNSAPLGSSALRLHAEASTTVTNCIFWGNAGPGTTEENQITLEPGATLSLSRSCIQGLTGALGGVGNFGHDPRLDTDGRLTPPSPCIDAGDSAAVPPGITTDLFGNPRIADDPGMPDGGPAAPAVDVGAHEFQGITCYANCDGSTLPPLLNVSDFTCFLQAFAAQNLYTNCDASTAAPVLNAQDFTCFLSQFVAGCP